MKNEKTDLVDISNLAHDLKSPLASSYGYAKAIKDGTINIEDNPEYVDRIISELERMTGYINAVQDMTRLQNGQCKFNKTAFDINALIVKCVLSLEKRIEEKHVDVKGLDNNKKLVYADIDFIGRAVYNIIDNAVKYVNENGYISFAFNEDKKNIIFSIENSGNGMTQEECRHVFDRFYRSVSAKAGSQKGLGLGLNITKGIIEQSGGKISISSAEKEYVRFTVSLPVPSCEKEN